MLLIGRGMYKVIEKARATRMAKMVRRRGCGAGSGQR
jgi:hypothetical protein